MNWALALGTMAGIYPQKEGREFTDVLVQRGSTVLANNRVWESLQEEMLQGRPGSSWEWKEELFGGVMFALLLQ